MNRTKKKLVPDGQPHERRHPLGDGGVKITTFVPLRFKKRGIKKVVVGPDGVDEPVAVNASAVAIAPTQDHTLLKALALAHYWDRQIDDGVVADASEIAQRSAREPLDTLWRLSLGDHGDGGPPERTAALAAWGAGTK